jgi:hypothetical protein
VVQAACLAHSRGTGELRLCGAGRGATPAAR